MKKVISLILISVMIMMLSINVFATDSLWGNVEEEQTPITGEEYENAQKDTDDNEITLPQTGVEDYKVGILFTIFVAGAVFAFRKVSEYRDI